MATITSPTGSKGADRREQDPAADAASPSARRCTGADARRSGPDDTADDDQDKATAIWPQTKGIVRKTGIVGVQFLHEGLKARPAGVKGGARNGRQRHVLARTLGERSSWLRHLQDGRLLGATSPTRVPRGAITDVTWFDPNFGEFWFEDRAAFIEWFPTFWHTALRRHAADRPQRELRRARVLTTR